MSLCTRSGHAHCCHGGNRCRGNQWYTDQRWRTTRNYTQGKYRAVFTLVIVRLIEILVKVFFSININVATKLLYTVLDHTIIILRSKNNSTSASFTFELCIFFVGSMFSLMYFWEKKLYIYNNNYKICIKLIWSDCKPIPFCATSVGIFYQFLSLI